MKFRIKLLSALLASPLLAGAAHAEWQVASSAHFVVYEDDTPEHVRAYATRLERYDRGMRLLHLMPEDKRGPSARVTVFVLGSTSDIHRLFGKGGQDVAGFYRGSAAGSVAFVPKNSGEYSNDGLTPQVILQHEYAHHFMLSNWTEAAFPEWFVEGFAEFHATARFRDDGSIIFGAPPIYRRYTIADSASMPIDLLLQPRPANLSSKETDGLYGRGWLLTHYLTFDPKRREQLASYIGALNSGKSVPDANKELGNVSGLDNKLNQYGQSQTFKSALFTPDQLPVGDITVRALTPGEAAIMACLIRSKRGVDKEHAGQVVTDARAVAANYPNDANVLNELAEAEFDAASTNDNNLTDFAAAEAAADRAISSDPKSVHALLYKGMAQMAIANKTKTIDASAWKDIRKWFLAANKIDPENPQPLALYYDSFVNSGQKPNNNAQDAILYAYALAPYDLELRVRAAVVLLEQGRLPQAKVALGPIAYQAEGRDGDKSPAIAAIASINAGDVTGAIDALKPKKKDDEKPSSK